MGAKVLGVRALLDEWLKFRIGCIPASAGIRHSDEEKTACTY